MTAESRVERAGTGDEPIDGGRRVPDDLHDVGRALRRGLGDFGPKYGCGQGTCGVCTVLVDGEPVTDLLKAAEDGLLKSAHTLASKLAIEQDSVRDASIFNTLLTSGKGGSDLAGCLYVCVKFEPS